MPAQIEASNSPFKFGEVLIGTSVIGRLSFVNHSAPDAQVTGVEPMQSPDGGFAVVNAFSGWIPPTADGAIIIRFIPTAERQYEGEFVFLVLSGHTIESATVKGTGVAFIERGALKIDASHVALNGALDCGIVPLGEAITVPFDIKNISNQPIMLTAAWSQGQYFSLPTPIVGIAETSSLHIDVAFAPQVLGIAYDVLRIADATGFDRIELAVQGTGGKVGDSGALTSPATHSSASGVAYQLDFGDVIVGHSRQMAFYVSNDSDAALKLGAKTLKGQAYSILEPHPLQMIVPAHDQLGFIVEFEPPAVGDYDDHLVISASTRDYIVRRLHGRGVNPLSPDHH